MGAIYKRPVGKYEFVFPPLEKRRCCSLYIINIYLRVSEKADN